ncbi:MAG: winged helix DNA-binding domain-containing protein [Burkholderiales bacterium]
MTRSELLRLRLRSQRAIGARHETPADVVSWLGAVQSQDYAAAKWALAQRVATTSDAAIDEVFSAGAILRTHVMRPTWHFVAPADIRWLVQLTGPRVNAMCAGYYRKMEIDSRVVVKSHRTIERALGAGRYLTRAAIAEALRKTGVLRASDGPLRVSFLVMRAELDGLICSGPRQGKQFTYALMEERVPRARPLSRDQALAAHVARYFISHGPAAVKDFVWWSGLTAADTRTGLEIVAHALERIEVDGTPYWMARDMPAEAVSARDAFLLPVYDEALLSYRDNREGPAGKMKQMTQDNGQTVVVGGRAVGTWRRTIGRKVVTVDVRPFEPLSARERRAIEPVVARYGAFLGVPAIVAYRR